MAIYDYLCSKCEHKQEEIHSIKEDPIIKCKKCGAVMKRIITGGTGIIFKGGGWFNSEKIANQVVESEHPEAAKVHREGKI